MRVRCDNATVVADINNQRGTKLPSLCILIWKFFKWLEQWNITLIAIHIKGTQNVKADLLSRSFARPLEWSLNNQVVHQIINIWERPLIDLFASEENHQLPLFCTRYSCWGAYQVDDLAMLWQGILGYAFPPIALIPRVLRKVQKTDCVVILIAPR